MAPSAREIFERNKDLNEPYLKGVHGTYSFEIENAGNWFVTVEDGKVTITEEITGEKKDADCVICCDEQEFVDIAEGRKNMLTAVLRGEMTIQGDAALAQRVHALARMRAEQRAGKERGAA